MDKLVVGILAHVDAGKTTLSEALLYRTGAVRTLGRVDHQDAFLDTFSMERQRGITIFSKQAQFPLQGREITLLDTPGHVDFASEMERTLQVLDAAILVISGTDGVQGHAQTLWNLLRRHRIPTFVFVNKMDLAGADRENVLSQLRRRFGEGCVDFTREDDAFMEAAATAEEAVGHCGCCGPWHDNALLFRRCAVAGRGGSFPGGACAVCAVAPTGRGVWSESV